MISLYDILKATTTHPLMHLLTLTHSFIHLQSPLYLTPQQGWGEAFSHGTRRHIYPHIVHTYDKVPPPPSPPYPLLAHIYPFSVPFPYLPLLSDHIYSSHSPLIPPPPPPHTHTTPHTIPHTHHFLDEA